MASEKTESYNARGGSSNVTQERKNKADGHGGVKTPPYIPGYTVGLPINPAWGAPLPGGIYASPTNEGIAYTNPKTLP